MKDESETMIVLTYLFTFLIEKSLNNFLFLFESLKRVEDVGRGVYR